MRYILWCVSFVRHIFLFWRKYSKMKDPYEVLGVSKNATTDEIKKAYRALAKKYHPDVYAGTDLEEVAKEKMQEVNEAYDYLKNNSGGSNSNNTANKNSYTDPAKEEYSAFVKSQILKAENLVMSSEYGEELLHICDSVLTENPLCYEAMAYKSLALMYKVTENFYHFEDGCLLMERSMQVCIENHSWNDFINVFNISSKEIANIMYPYLITTKKKIEILEEMIGCNRRHSIAYKQNGLYATALKYENDFKKNQEEKNQLSIDISDSYTIIYNLLMKIMNNINVNDVQFESMIELADGFVRICDVCVQYDKDKSSWDSIYNFATIQKSRAEKGKKEKYWKEHPEEIKNFKKEKQDIKRKTDELREKCKKLNEEKIEPLRKELRDKNYEQNNYKFQKENVDAIKERADIVMRISTLKGKIDNLGLFKKKEKQAISAQMEELKSQLPEIDERINVQQNEIDLKINDLNREMQKISEELKKSVLENEKMIKQLDEWNKRTKQINDLLLEAGEKI